MNYRLVRNPGPHISTPITNRLLGELERIARRRPDIANTVERIRHGDDQLLLKVVQQVQTGDQEAALVALGALLPFLCKIVLSRYPKLRWESIIDDYVVLAHLTLGEAKLTGEPTHLLGRLLSRTRRRHDRQFENRTAGVLPLADLDLTADPLDVEQVVIARVTLDQLMLAIRAGRIEPSQWGLVRAIAAEEGPTGRMSQAERQQLRRARRALAEFRDWRVAA
jgi:hypothetical protein